MRRNIRFVTRTALLLAVAILFQYLGKYMGTYNNFIVGPIVNAVLLIATEIVGIFSGIFISVAAPLVSALTNKAAIAPVILAFSPFIMAGNAIYAVIYALLNKRKTISSGILAVVAASILKFGFLFGSVLAFTRFMNINEKVAGVLIGLFSWPQLVTALIGGAVAALIICPALKRVLNDQN
ncbi:MAG TPA: ECF transporter S component [Thermoclostridium sp.]